MAGKKKRKSSKKRKGSKRRRAAPKKKRVVRKQKLHIGAGVGTAKSGYDFFTADLYGATVGHRLLASVTDPAQRTAILSALKSGTLASIAWREGKPMLLGVAVSYGEDAPVVGPMSNDLVKRPLNKLIGKTTVWVVGKTTRNDVELNIVNDYQEDPKAVQTAEEEKWLE